MKKRIIKPAQQFILLMMSIGMFSYAYSQKSLGIQSSYLKMLNGSPVSNVGFGAKLEFIISEKLTNPTGFNYYFPSTTTSYVEGKASFIGVTPETIQVQRDLKFSGFQIQTGLKGYFVGGYEDDFNVYGLAEFGFMYTSSKITFGDYDSYSYDVEGANEILPNRSMSFVMDFGLGVEKNLNFAYLFFNAQYNILRLSSLSSTPPEIGNFLSANVGLRFLLL